MKWLSTFFASVGRFYGVLSIYRSNNDKCVNHIKKDMKVIARYRSEGLGDGTQDMKIVSVN